MYGRAGPLPRLVLLALLAVLVAVGLHGQVTAPEWARRSQSYDAQVVGTLLVVAAVLVLALAARGRRLPPGQFLAARLHTALWYLLGIGIPALAVALVLLVVNVGPLPSPPPRPAAPLSGVRPGRSAAAGAASATSHFPVPAILYGLAAAILVVAIAAVTWMIVRHARRVPAAEPQAPAQEYGEALQEALWWGQRALLELDDARAAIIACYLAMEQSLARAGTARARAETPDELLARAARALPISTGAASRLTELFYEARFSSHLLLPAHREAAERALAELVSGLDAARPRPAPVAP